MTQSYPNTAQNALKFQLFSITSLSFVDTSLKYIKIP